MMCVLALMLGSTVNAEECHPFYVGASGGLALLQNQGDAMGAVEYDAGLAFSTFLGWNEGPGRLEFEYSRFNNEVNSIGGVNATSGNVDVSTIMMNGYLDLPITSRITGYIGGGLGVAQSQLNSLQVGGNEGQATSDVVLAYQAKVGASMAITQRADIFAGYRFLGTEKGTVVLYDFGHFADQIHLHSLETGLRFKF